jgi:hypothetical protein
MSEDASPVLGPYTTVLVAILKEPRDLEIARDRHWYRIPVKRLPTRAAEAPVLAFYQTRAFGEERWAIRYYALARRWAQVRRVDLLPEEPEHPRADEAYYQVWLGPLHALPRPIVSRHWRRITFIVTHWQRLHEVEAVEELLHGTVWDEYLWKAMRSLGYLAEHLLKEVRGWFGRP